MKITVAVWELTTGGADGVMCDSCVFTTVGGVAIGVTSSIMYPYKWDHTIDDAATVKNGV